MLETLLLNSSQVIGRLEGFDDNKRPIVKLKQHNKTINVIAETTQPLSIHQLGEELILTVINERVIITGIIQADSQQSNLPVTKNDLKLNDKVIEFSANESILLKCGKAEIRLTSDGKVSIKGHRVLSKAKATNAVKGGSVKLN